MLGKMASKLQKTIGGTASKSKDAGKREEAPSSSSTAKTTSSGTGAKGASGSSRPSSSQREKPPQPVLTDEQARAQHYATPLPAFRDVPPSEKQHLFVQKLHLCAFTFDFSDPTKHVREKEMKRQTLLEVGCRAWEGLSCRAHGAWAGVVIGSNHAGQGAVHMRAAK